MMVHTRNPFTAEVEARCSLELPVQSAQPTTPGPKERLCLKNNEVDGS